MTRQPRLRAGFGIALSWQRDGAWAADRFMLSWRGVFVGMGALSALVGTAVLTFARDPLWRRADHKKEVRRLID
eukprot:1185765-Prorocentrum_minimum.AAC.1